MHLAVFDLSCLLWEALTGGPPRATGTRAAAKVAAILRELQPTHAAAACDLPWPTWRHDLTAHTYKAHRREPDPQRMHGRTTVMGQQGPCRELLEDVLGVPTFSARGYEADDIVATLCGLGRNAGARVTIVAVDKDFCQLVQGAGDSATVVMRNARDGATWDALAVHRQYGVWPDQFADYQALVGDQSDGYNGCPGIGPKQAIMLLGQYGSLERCLEQSRRYMAASTADMLFEPPEDAAPWYFSNLEARKRSGKGPLALLSKGRAAVELSAKLARLHTAVPGMPTALVELAIDPVPEGAFT